jgi:hypothetical protein
VDYQHYEVVLQTQSVILNLLSLVIAEPRTRILHVDFVSMVLLTALAHPVELVRAIDCAEVGMARHCGESLVSLSAHLARSGARLTHITTRSLLDQYEPASVSFQRLLDAANGIMDALSEYRKPIIGDSQFRFPFRFLIFILIIQ